MADASKRRGAGAAGAGDTRLQETLDSKETPKRRARSSKRDPVATRTRQSQIFQRQLLEFEIVRPDGSPLRFGVPIEFTIGDIANRKALDDLDAFARLSMLEARKLAGDDAPAGFALFSSAEHAAYTEIALSLSGVRDLCRRLTVKVARVIVDDAVTDQRITAEDLLTLSTGDMLMLSLWYIRRWFEVVSKSKNALRAEPTTRPKTTGE